MSPKKFEVALVSPEHCFKWMTQAPKQNKYIKKNENTHTHTLRYSHSPMQFSYHYDAILSPIHLEKKQWFHRKWWLIERTVVEGERTRPWQRMSEWVVPGAIPRVNQSQGRRLSTRQQFLNLHFTGTIEPAVASKITRNHLAGQVESNYKASDY